MAQLRSGELAEVMGRLWVGMVAAEVALRRQRLHTQALCQDPLIRHRRGIFKDMVQRLQTFDTKSSERGRMAGHHLAEQQCHLRLAWTMACAVDEVVGRAKAAEAEAHPMLMRREFRYQMASWCRVFRLSFVLSAS